MEVHQSYSEQLRSNPGDAVGRIAPSLGHSSKPAACERYQGGLTLIWDQRRSHSVRQSW